MNLFVYICQIFLGLLFLSTATDKLLNWGKHLQSIEAYKIIKEKPLIIIALVCFLISELIISIFLLFFNSNYFIIGLCLTILIVYTVAIGINLLRGVKDISCGCGGILEQEQLTPSMIIRNLFLIMIAILVLIFGRELEFSITHRILIGMNVSAVILVIGIISQLKKINQRLEFLFEGEK